MELGRNNMEKFFKKSFEDFQPDVDPKVWNNIQNSLNGSKSSGTSWLGSLGAKLIIGSAAVALVTVSSLFFFQKGNEQNIPSNTKNISEKIKSPVVSQNNPTVIPEQKIKPVNNTPVNKNSNHISANTSFSNDVKNSVQPKTDSEKTPLNNNNTAVQPENNSKQDKTPPQVYSNPSHPGMNMPEKTSAKNQNNEEQNGNITSNENDNAAVTNTKLAKIDFRSEGGTGTYAPLTVYFTNKGKANTEEWNFGDGSFARFEKNPVYVFEFPGEYTITLTATSETGRIEKDSIRIKVHSNAFFIPNTFTPNGDGNNDIYKIIKNDSYPYDISKLEIVVYDRNGSKMTGFNSCDYGWDGVSIKDGKMCPQGTYLVVIKYMSSEDGKMHEERGSLFLKN